MLSVIFAPSILWYSLPQSSEALVDFFREFSVHVDSLGYVCSFAVFDFKRNGNIKFGAPSEVQNDYYVSKDGKMEKSFLTFKAHNPDWKPDMEGSQMFLNAVLQKRGQTASPIVSPEPKVGRGNRHKRERRP